MPFHYDQWMVILQRWEPTISATFPSKIPFWIELQGLPKHFWKPEMLKTIGEELGEMMDADIYPSAAKIRVLIDEFQHLTKETVVEFPDGSEALVYLEYKNLKNHCQHCYRLTHELKYCPGISAASDIPRSPVSKSSSAVRTTSRNYYTPGDNFLAPTHISQSSEKSYNPQRDTSTHKRTHVQARERSDPSFIDRPTRSFGESGRRSGRSPDSRRRAHYKDDDKLYNPRHSLHWREKTPLAEYHQETSDSSRTRRPPLERNLDISDHPTLPSSHLSSSCRRTLNPLEITPSPALIPSKEQVMGELREVTIQYTACADPTESAAQKHRVF